MPHEPTVHIVDDDDAVLMMLNALIGSVYKRVKTYASAKEFLERYEPEAGPGCVVLDVRMPVMNGPEMQEELRKRKIDLPIIFLTGHGDIQMAVQAIKRGAYDFVEKPYDNLYLLGQIRGALTKIMDDIDNIDERRKEDARRKSLTTREREVLALVIEGVTNKGVARELGISDKTVEVHRANVMRKMEARSFADLVRMAAQEGNQ